MKIRKFMFLTGLVLALVTLMSSECNKVDTNPTCDGYASAESSGAFTNNFCFDTLNHFNYESSNVYFMASQPGDVHYTLDFSINPCDGPGTYNCGQDQPGFLELIVHGDDNEFFKSQSGTITITKIDENHVEGSYEVITEGYYNHSSLNLKGNIYRAWK